MEARKLNALEMVALWLVIIGGLNWLLVGLVNVDLVAWLLGQGSMLSRVVYVVVGLAAVWLLLIGMKLRRQG